MLDAAWTQADREAVIVSLCKQAKKGNVQAAALLLAYAYGKPTEKHEHAGADGGPLVLKIVYADK